MPTTIVPCDASAYPNPCNQCGAANGSNCGHGLGGNQGVHDNQGGR